MSGQSLFKWRKWEPSPLLSLVGLLVLYAFLYSSIRSAAVLREREYHNAILCFRVYDSLLLVGLTTLLGLGTALRAKWMTWQELDEKGLTRAFFVVIAGVLVWALSTMSYNAYFGQSYLVDRALLVVLLSLCWWRPLFLLPLSVQIGCFASQLHFPLPAGHWMWPDKLLLLDALILAACFFMLRAVFGRFIHRSALLSGVLCLIGATYGTAAWNKALIGPELWSWVTENRVSNVFMSSYVQSRWLGFLSEAQAQALARLLSRGDIFVTSFTWIVEASALTLFFSRRWAMLLLLLLCAMHVGIVLSTGIFFWKWILLDLTLLLVLFQLKSRPHEGPRFGWSWGCAGLCLGLLLMHQAPFVKFAWRDSRYVNFARYTAVGKSGRRYPLDARFFAPYDVLSTQARFPYLTPRPTLVGTFGATGNFALGRLLDESPRSFLPTIFQKYGRVRYSERATVRFAKFMQRFVRHRMDEPERLWALNSLAPPRHFRNSRLPGSYRFQEPITQVIVSWHEFSFFDQNLHQERVIPLIQIPIAESAKVTSSNKSSAPTTKSP